MASVSIYRERRRNGTTRYRVTYRLGGRESKVRHGGSFRTLREAKQRRDWIAGEIASLRVPDPRLLDAEPKARTLRDVAEGWRTSRVDVAAGTAATHRVNLRRILPVLGETAVEEITADEIAAFVSTLHADGLARESIRKTVSTLAQVLDHAERNPNPARDRRVRLPQEDREEVRPPSAAHVETVYRLVPSAYRLPLLVADASGMRVGEIEALTWGDVDEPERRFRVSQARSKTRTGRFVPVPDVLFQAVIARVPREDRSLAAPVFSGFNADAFRTALTRACKAAGIPAFSPHDLRHRRASLWHLGGVPAAQAAAWLGHSPVEHVRTYAHVVLDRRELDYAALLRARKRSRGDTPVTRVG
jgi:integrase